MTADRALISKDDLKRPAKPKNARRALIKKDDLTRMACVVSAHNVVLKGRIDPEGGFTFTMERCRSTGVLTGDDIDDLDDKIDKFVAQ